MLGTGKYGLRSLAQKVTTKLPYIAEDNGEIVGFGELEADGHIDCFYCHSKYQKMGIGSKLLSHIENTANYKELNVYIQKRVLLQSRFFKARDLGL
jgi:ribosomal protein S18 acetylase RimI-like enzyme